MALILFSFSFLFAEKNFDHDLLDRNCSDFNNIPISLLHNTLSQKSSNIFIIFTIYSIK